MRPAAAIHRHGLQSGRGNIGTPTVQEATDDKACADGIGDGGRSVWRRQQRIHPVRTRRGILPVSDKVECGRWVAHPSITRAALLTMVLRPNAKIYSKVSSTPSVI